MQSRRLKALLCTNRPVADFGEYIAVGSSLCHDLIKVNKKTMKLSYALDAFHEGRKSIRSEELELIWDKLESLIASGELTEIICGVDDIPVDKRIPVFYRDDESFSIKESYTDVLEWPNTTFDGRLMYENMYFSTRALAVDDAIKDGLSYIKYRTENMMELKNKLHDITKGIRRTQAFLSRLYHERGDEELAESYTVKKVVRYKEADDL